VKEERAVSDFPNTSENASNQSINLNSTTKATNRTAVGICIGLGGIEPCTGNGEVSSLPVSSPIVDIDADVGLPLPISAGIDADVDLSVGGIGADVGICIGVNGETPCSQPPSGSGGHGSGGHGGGR
jgi:hypothetical protein